ncbi:MAG: SPOR domain-containing protein [Gammaproteobacteria bacterium]|nr:SPOR domain-containing protein [Gammaproteobacteria bacterium]
MRLALESLPVMADRFPWCTPDRQFQALVLLVVLCLLGWRMEPGEPPVPGARAPAVASLPAWTWLAAAQASELEAQAPAGQGRLPPPKAEPVAAPAIALREVPGPADARRDSASAAPVEPTAEDASPPRWRPAGAEDYAVQLGVFGSWHNALRAARELRGRSLRPELVLDDGPKPVLRLVVGHFPSRDQALAAVRSYRQQRHADAWIYGREPATISARWAR